MIEKMDVELEKDDDEIQWYFHESGLDVEGLQIPTNTKTGTPVPTVEKEELDSLVIFRTESSYVTSTIYPDSQQEIKTKNPAPEVMLSFYCTHNQGCPLKQGLSSSKYNDSHKEDVFRNTIDWLGGLDGFIDSSDKATLPSRNLQINDLALRIVKLPSQWWTLENFNKGMRDGVYVLSNLSTYFTDAFHYFLNQSKLNSVVQDISEP